MSFANTGKSTTKNLSSRLLQLPQELKIQIYTYVVSGKCIHVEEIQMGRSPNPYVLYPCRATVTSSSAQQIFDAATNIDPVQEIEKELEESYFETFGLDEETQDDTENGMDNDVDSGTNTSKFVCVDPHRRCYSLSTLKIPRSCMTTRKQRMPPIQTLKSPFRTMQTARKPALKLATRGNNPDTSGFWSESREILRLPFRLLRTCRQIYHDMGHLIYSANTFSFQEPALLSRFRFGPRGEALAIRRLHLHVTIPDGYAEKEWNRAFETLVRRFRNLSSVDISIDQAIWNDIKTDYHSPRENPSMSERNTFLTGLSELKKLKFLREMTLVVTDVYPWEAWAPSQFLWSDADKQRWVHNIRADILGKTK